jgi:hypothetical protein
VNGRTLTLRAIALLAAGSAAIHQARYAIGYGQGAGRELAAHGHGYLTVALPFVVAAVVLALASLLMRVARGRQARSGASLHALWLVAALALAVIFTVQESLEGASVIQGGGWIGLALAVPAGLLVALALRGAASAEPAAGPGARLGFRVLLDARTGAAPALRAGRITPPAAGARAPPLASIV